MGLVTPTLDGDSLTVVGDRYQINGTVVVSTAANELDKAIGNALLSVMITGNQSNADGPTPKIMINVEDDFSTAAPGKFAIQGDSASDGDTYSFTAQFR